MDIPLPFDAPPGYRWHYSEAVQAAVLLPDYWVTLDLISKNGIPEVRAYPPDYHGSGECRGAFSFNAIADVSKKYGITASDHSRTYGIARIKATHQTLWDTEQASADGMVLSVVQFRSTLPDIPRIVHRLMLADDANDILRWCTFEATESLWEQAWPVGEFMLNHLCLVQTYSAATPKETRLH